MRMSSKAKHITRYKRKQCSLCDIPFDLDVEWVYERLIKGCELTGLPFKIDAKGKPHQMSPSIDRIDPSGGYLKSNCRMILNGLNMMKGSGNDETMFVIARALIENKPQEEKILIEPELRYFLDQHFTERQVEIIFKKKHQLRLDKTEGEYYSRTIKKKLKLLGSTLNWARDLYSELHMPP